MYLYFDLKIGEKNMETPHANNRAAIHTIATHGGAADTDTTKMDL